MAKYVSNFVRFKGDIHRYPSAIFDLQTSNTSFVKYALLLKKLGIANWNWGLALLQKELQGVDPRSPDLTDEQKMMINREVLHNPIYYFREVLWLPASTATGYTQFRATRGNMAAIWCYFCHATIALTQPRQTGKTVVVEGIFSWCALFGAVNTQHAFITIKTDNQTQVIKSLNRIREGLPNYLVQKDRNDADNSKYFTYHTSGNRIDTFVLGPEASKDKAETTGRGLTAPTLAIDECPYMAHLKSMLASAMPATTAARDNAIISDRPYGNLMVTTAAEIDSPSGEYFFNLISKALQWSETLFDCVNEADLHDRIVKGCRGDGDLVFASFNHRQLGYDDAWLRKKARDTFSSGDQLRKDWLNIWVTGSEASPFSSAQLTAIREGTMEPEFIETTDDGMTMRWYVPSTELDTYMKNNKVVIGLDTSDGIGEDGIGVILINTNNGHVVCSCSINQEFLQDAAMLVANLMVRYKNTTLVIERKSSAMTFIGIIIQVLLNLNIDPFQRMYNRIVQDKEELAKEWQEINKPMQQRDAAIYKRYARYFGFVTTGSNRETLYREVLMSAVQVSAHGIKDKTLVNEMSGLVKKNNRVDHVSGGHDDMVISYLLAQWLLRYGANLSYYGISPGEIMRDLGDANYTVEESRKRSIDNKQSNKLLSQLESYIEELAIPNKSSWHTTMIEHKVRSIENQLERYDMNTVNVNQLMEDAKLRALQ